MRHRARNGHDQVTQQVRIFEVAQQVIPRQGADSRLGPPHIAAERVIRPADLLEQAVHVLRGESWYIRSSSSTTSRSFSSSAESSNGWNSMSPSTSMASFALVLGTRAQYIVSSLSVAAVRTPPTPSIASAISLAPPERADPLKNMCSRKWL